ncbi:MAG: elongation factor Ts [Candidatus Ryanbacteria bacterium RIFCSPHIGHO2_01_FULL_45_22]|uniref:Elongation factor Ts n=2 Tax=Candidatus Ryaniibacteriota TaxID=1817914 RepID=A0A1G2G086_9BACT|nr:MAG: elongation factor Ts [Candidatus Ryanbacteria bacterium RIFCSPHIGHO2_01_FULL_45_22]OGZ46369.1 MAG: elongation factor Ts [Candidatus Ryanbacteria bacterium RIFCSPHIGHO2_02_FULL_45_13b]
MINLDILKELREQTDASIGACKTALEKADGNITRAMAFLREEGSKVAKKKSTRHTGIGLVEAYVHTNQRMGALLEIRSETDFVARNPEFKKLAHDIAMHITASAPENVPMLLEQPFIKDESKTVGALITESISRFGENIQITQFSRFEV